MRSILDFRPQYPPKTPDRATGKSLGKSLANSILWSTIELKVRYLESVQRSTRPVNHRFLQPRMWRKGVYGGASPGQGQGTSTEARLIDLRQCLVCLLRIQGTQSLRLHLQSGLELGLAFFFLSGGNQSHTQMVVVFRGVWLFLEAFL
jgi:hypothetical protein